MRAKKEALASPGGTGLITVGGPSGSGKTRLAQALAPRLGRSPGAVVLRSAVIRKRDLGAPEPAHLDPATYSPAASERVYGALRRLARVALAARQDKKQGSAARPAKSASSRTWRLRTRFASARRPRCSRSINRKARS